MIVKLMRTRDWQEPGDECCAVCEETFPLTEVSPVLVSDSNIELGELCFPCAVAGEEYIVRALEKRAAFNYEIAKEDERIAAEGVEYVPSVDELLAAESFYGE